MIEIAMLRKMHAAAVFLGEPASTELRKLIDEICRLHQERNKRQSEIVTWMTETFGPFVATSPRERALRFLEESMELAQACGLTWDDFDKLAKRVFNRDIGEVKQEVGGVGVTLLALCEIYEISADQCERDEFARVLTKDPEEFRKRQAVKVAEGVAVE